MSNEQFLMTAASIYGGASNSLQPQAHIHLYMALNGTVIVVSAILTIKV